MNLRTDSRAYRLLQWNCQGLRNKKDELLDHIHNNKIDIVFIQETMLDSRNEFRLPGFNVERRDGHVNRTPHGGVATFIHSDLPYERLPLTTEIQAVAIRVQLSSLITFCNIYSSRSHNLTTENLEHLFLQLPAPVVLLGDFNAYSLIWGSRVNDTRGTQVERFMNRNGINILNSGVPTRISYHAETCIDLTMCSPSLASDMEWSVMDSPGASDHCPIIVSIFGDRSPATEYFQDIKNADWRAFQRCDVWQDLPNIDQLSNDVIVLDLYTRLNAASQRAIPTFLPQTYYPRPWWTPELTVSKLKRERLYQISRRHRSEENTIRWKRARAEHKKLVREEKRNSWKALSETLNYNTPIAAVYHGIRKIKGKRTRRTHIIREDGRTYSDIGEITEKLADSIESTSRDSNFSPDFIAYKRNAETNPLNFNDDSYHFYNAPFTMEELNYCLNKAKDTTPGPDGIHYKTLKNLPLEAKSYLLNIFQKLAIIFSFEKPCWDEHLIFS